MKRIIKTRILSLILMIGWLLLLNYITEGKEQDTFLYLGLSFIIFDIIYWVNYLKRYQKRLTHLKEGLQIYDEDSFENLFVKEPWLYWAISIAVIIMSIVAISDDIEILKEDLLPPTIYLLVWFFIKTIKASIYDEKGNPLLLESGFKRVKRRIPREIIVEMVRSALSEKIPEGNISYFYDDDVVMYVKNGADEKTIKIFAINLFKKNYLNELIEELKRKKDRKIKKEKELAEYREIIKK